MIKFNEIQSSCAHTELENATTSALLARSPTTTCSGTRSFPALSGRWGN